MLLATLIFAGPAWSQSVFKDGKIHLVQSSHHDLGWHKGSYPAEMRFTLNEIDTALDLMNKDTDFTFCGEYTIWLHEYLKHRPGRVEELKRRLKEGRMEWGGGYSQPYTSLMTSEQLARQMIYGTLWYKKHFPGKATLYYNTDIPGFNRQMPQILRKSGIDKAFLSRTDNIAGIDTDFANWVGPDGSSVFCYLMHHYADQVGQLRDKNKYGLKINNTELLARWLRSLEPYYKDRNIPPQAIHFLCMDCRPPSDYSKDVAAWNQYAKTRGLPPIEYSTLATVMDTINDEKAKFKTLKGEWPSKWVYEAAPSNYRRVSDQRASDRLLRAAEAFSVFRALIEGGFDNYPAEVLADGWKNGLFSCHGFAPRSVLAEYSKRYTAARDAGEKALTGALEAITARVKTQTRGIPLVVYNTLSWDRSDYVSMPVPADAPPAAVAMGTPMEFHIVDSEGKEVPFQMTTHVERTNTVVGSKGRGPFEVDKVRTTVSREDRIVFRADGVPSFGYKTWYLVKGKSKLPATTPVPRGTWKTPHENAFFAIEPGVGGLRRIYDKTLKRELLKVDRFMGCEWLDYMYNGQGAGGFAFMKIPEATRELDLLRNYKPTWTCVESGPVFTAYETSTARTRRGGVTLRVVVYESTRRIDVQCVVTGMDYKQARQLRLAFGLNAKRRNVTYEAPFGVVNVGKDELDPGLVAGRTSARPRETQNWIYAGDDTGGVTIGSNVVAWDYDVVSTARPEATDKIDYPILQPVLLTTAYSCSRWVHCWTQPGDHVFDFSIYSHKAGWTNGYRDGVQTNNPLIAVVQTKTKAPQTRATLGETHSFLSIAGSNMIVTAVKKAEEGEGIVVRFYENEGKRDSNAAIKIAGTLKGAVRTNLIEEGAGDAKLGPDGVTLKVGPFSIETVKLTPKF